MTRPFNAYYDCQWCGKSSSAETAFGRWMRGHAALDSVHGIVRTDTDHWILRYKTSLDDRVFQLLMLVEVKEHGAAVRPDQLDILHFVHVGMVNRGKNMHGAPTTRTYTVRSMVTGKLVQVRYYGYHLLQFQNTNPEDGWIKWDRKLIDKGKLLGLLAMERDPYQPDRWMIELLRDRHWKQKNQLALSGMEAAA